MEITDVRIRSVKPEGKLRAFASITLDHCLAIHNLKVIEGEKGLFVAMPSRKTNKGEFKDVVHPTSSELRNDLEKIVIGEYEKVLEEGGLDSASGEDEEPSYETAPAPVSEPVAVSAPEPVVAPVAAPVTPEPVIETAPEPAPEPRQQEAPEEKKSSGSGFSFRSLMGGK